MCFELKNSWASLTGESPTFHYWLYPVWLCMWQINKNLEVFKTDIWSSKLMTYGFPKQVPNTYNTFDLLHH